MTKLYHGAEGWIVPGKQDKKAERADVPNSPDELASWLNERAVPPQPSSGDLDLMRECAEKGMFDPGLASEPPPAGSADAGERRNRCPDCKSLLVATPEGADRAAWSRDLTKLDDWLDRAPDWAIERLAEQVMEKARAFRDAAGRVQ